MDIQSTINQLRKEFFAFRNGIVAEALRNSGDPHTIIMGCQLTDLVAITSHLEKNEQLAQTLWNDTQHRECRMAATMLYPPHLMSQQAALDWCHSVESTEVADVLCHRLLRHTPCTTQLCMQLLLENDNHAMVEYTALRLLLNLLLLGKIEKTPQLRNLITTRQAQHTHPTLQPLLSSILEEL